MKVVYPEQDDIDDDDFFWLSEEDFIVQEDTRAEYEN